MKFFPILLITLAIFGCASSGDVTQVRQDVSTVYSEQASYRDRTDARLTKMERDMKELQRNLSSPDSGIRKQMVDLSLAGESRDEKMKGLLGRIDELDSQLRTYWEEVKGEIKQLKRDREAKNQSPPETRVSSDELYKEGFEAFQKGSYQEAARTLSQFTKQFPDTSLTPNAFFWIGESFMNLRDYEKAILQYQELLDKFPKSDKAGRAMLRQAEAFTAMGDKKSSMTLFKRIMELFPKTEESRVAERRLRGGSLQ
jgi:tol-pal system protein YbgF